MDTALTSMAVASSGMRAQGLRVRLAAENMANADSPHYQKRTVSFGVSNPSDQRDVDFVAVKKIDRDRSDFKKTYDPGNPLAGKDGYVIGSNVNELVEIMDAKEAQRSYEASLNMFEQARALYNQTIDLLRA